MWSLWWKPGDIYWNQQLAGGSTQSPHFNAVTLETKEKSSHRAEQSYWLYSQRIIPSFSLCFFCSLEIEEQYVAADVGMPHGRLSRFSATQVPPLCVCVCKSLSCHYPLELFIWRLSNYSRVSKTHPDTLQPSWGPHWPATRTTMLSKTGHWTHTLFLLLYSWWIIVDITDN